MSHDCECCEALRQIKAGALSSLSVLAAFDDTPDPGLLLEIRRKLGTIYELASRGDRDSRGGTFGAAE
jgi:hypothetical protein